MVQVDSTSDPGLGRIVGRIEHILSGETAGFESAEALVHFIAQAVSKGGGPTCSAPKLRGEQP